MRSISLKQNGSVTIRTPNVLSSAIMFLATFLGLSKIKVVGFYDKYKICHATSGISLKTLYIIRSPFSRTIMLLVSSRCFKA
jgi:hypothetical protein